MEKPILIKKNMTIFGYNFEIGSWVTKSEDYLTIKFITEDSQLSIPVICCRYNKTSLEFMNEILKQNK